ncbi:MAG: hypothetical protein II192_02985 [Clostridia bacterium]|nr:hypothetical protein [Clostridia bacterium]MBQ4297628.1 hypothetical protein [Clostridia bacterium]
MRQTLPPDARAYLREVCRRLPCSRGVKTAFRKRLSAEIADWLETGGSSGTEALRVRFGAPEEIADGFFRSNDALSLIRTANRQKAVCSVLLVLSLLFLAVSGAVLGDRIRIEQKYLNGKILVSDVYKPGSAPASYRTVSLKPGAERN